MRYFPSAARQRLAAASVAGVVALGLLTSTAGSTAQADDGSGGRSGTLKHRQKAVSGRLASATGDLDDASHEIVTATRAVQAARTGLATARTHLDDVSTRLDDARSRVVALRADLVTSQQQLADAETALAGGKSAVHDQRGRVRDNAISTYAAGDLRLRAVNSLLGSTSLSDLTANLTVESIVVRRGTQTFGDLHRAKQGLADRKDDVAAATAAVADRTEAAATQVRTAQGLYAEAVTAKRDVAALVARGVRAKQHAFAVRAHDRQVIQRLRARESTIKQRILAIAARETGGYSGRSNGFLSYPADAPITSPFGYRVHPIYGYYSLHNGTDFGVACGTPLKAAAAGTVIDEYYDSVYGNRLYLNVGRVNGHNLTLVYNHLTSYVAREGQHVARGAIVAHSGTTGWSTGCHLHFTVLVDGVAVDPMTYL